MDGGGAAVVLTLTEASCAAGHIVQDRGTKVKDYSSTR
jgi:hypothetical protein